MRLKSALQNSYQEYQLRLSRVWGVFISNTITMTKENIVTYIAQSGTNFGSPKKHLWQIWFIIFANIWQHFVICHQIWRKCVVVVLGVFWLNLVSDQADKTNPKPPGIPFIVTQIRKIEGSYPVYLGFFFLHAGF